MDDATLTAISEAIRHEFADEDTDLRPVMVTKCVVVAEAFLADGERALFTWRPVDMTAWDAIGMLEAQAAKLKRDFSEG